MPKFLGGDKKCYGFARKHFGQVYTNALGIINVAPAHQEIGLITIDNLRYSDRLATVFIGIPGTAGEDPGPILSLPKCENVGAVRVLVVVSNGKGLGPVAAFSVRCTNNPRACSLIAAVSQPDTGSDRDKNRASSARPISAEQCASRASTPSRFAPCRPYGVPDVSRR